MTIFEDLAERFEREMLDASHIDDTEVRHGRMDDIMCEFLEEIGCCSGVKIFRESTKWYG